MAIAGGLPGVIVPSLYEKSKLEEAARGAQWQVYRVDTPSPVSLCKYFCRGSIMSGTLGGSITMSSTHVVCLPSCSLVSDGLVEWGAQRLVYRVDTPRFGTHWCLVYHQAGT